MRPFGRYLAVAAALGGVACTEAATRTRELPDYASQFIFYYPHLRYLYVDSTAGANLRLEWTADSTFQGYTCLQFVPNTATDSVGTFYFVINGSNQGQLQRTLEGATDSLEAFFLPVQPLGSEGTFHVSGTGRVTLNWANGTPSRYFDPSAVLQVVGDTLFSNVTLGFTNGFVEWQVGWLRVGQCI